MTDMLEADLKGDLPDGKQLSTHPVEEDQTDTIHGEENPDPVHGEEKPDPIHVMQNEDIRRSVKNREAHLKPTSLLSYLGKRPKLVSFYS